MKKNKQYEALKKINRDSYINTFIRKYESFMNTVFTYENLPETLKADYIEKMMYYNGACVFAHVPAGENIDGTKHKEGVYAFRYNPSGVLNAWDEPTQNINISEYLKYNSIDNFVDCVLMANNASKLPTVETVNKYAIYMYDNELSLNLNIVLSRVPYLLSASDENTMQSAQNFIQSVINGDYKIIGESAFLEGVKVNNTAQNSNTLVNYIETLQYYKASLMHELGVNANYNMKREALNGSEIDVNVNSLKPIINDMYRERLKAIEELNRKFGLNVSVVLNEPWDLGVKENDTTEDDPENVLENDSESEPNDSESEPNDSESEPDESEEEQEHE